MVVLGEKDRDTGFVVERGWREGEVDGVGEQCVLLSSADEGLASGASIIAIEGCEVKGRGS